MDNDSEPREATSFTEQELQEMMLNDQRAAEQVRSIYSQQIAFLEAEIQRITEIFLDFTSRSGVLLTVAGLFSFLPPIILADSHEYLENFLVWTFPLLVGALYAYAPSAKRLSPIIKGIAFYPLGTHQELIIQRNRARTLVYFHEQYVMRYDRMLLWTRALSVLVYAYITSLWLNLYHYVFLGTPSSVASLKILLWSLALGGALVLHSVLMSQRSKMIK